VQKDHSAAPVARMKLISPSALWVAVADKDCSDLGALLNLADKALYRAKMMVRNRVELPPPGVERQSTNSASSRSN